MAWSALSGVAERNLLIALVWLKLKIALLYMTHSASL